MTNINYADYDTVNISVDFFRNHFKQSDYFLIGNKLCRIPYCLDYVKKHRLAFDCIIDNDRELYLQDFDDSDNYMLLEAIKALHETSNGALPKILDEAINQDHIAKIKQLLPECLEFDTCDSQAEHNYYCDRDSGQMSFFYFEIQDYISQLSQYLYQHHLSDLLLILGIQPKVN